MYPEEKEFLLPEPGTTRSAVQCFNLNYFTAKQPPGPLNIVSPQMHVNYPSIWFYILKIIVSTDTALVKYTDCVCITFNTTVLVLSKHLAAQYQYKVYN